MTIERRVYRTEFRDVPGSNGRQKWATAVTYDTVDDFGTIWASGVFDKALAERMPAMLYGHDWHTLEHVLGKGIDHRQTPPDVGPPGVDVLLEFDDPEFVPMARQAMWQVSHKTLRDVSVGFERREWIRRNDLTPEQRERGAEELMIEAGMDELSIVIRGAVLGAQFRGRRTSKGIDFDAFLEIAKRKAAGDLSDEEARVAVELLGDEEAEHENQGAGGSGVESGEENPPPPDDSATEELLGELDDALDTIGRSRR
jgi:hypothetical protein